MPAVEPNALASASEGEPSSTVRARVNRARTVQLERFRRHRFLSNAQMGARDLRRFCALESEGERLLYAAMDRFGLSARAYGRILKLARTIADLAGEEQIRAPHVAEAIQYRALDRSL